MEKNVGTNERFMRGALGAVLILGFFFTPLEFLYRVSFLVTGLILAATSFMGFCLSNKLIGRNSCGVNHVQ